MTNTELATLRAELKRERAYYDQLHDSTISLRAEVESARESFAMLYEMLRDNPTYHIAAGVAKSGIDRAKEALK